jgi:DNA recombination protein RmuC
MEIIYLVIGIVIGLLLGYLTVKIRLSAVNSKLEEKEKIIFEKDRLIEDSKKEISAERERLLLLSNELSANKSNFLNLQQKLNEKISEFDDMENRFSAGFENLAGRILEDKSRKFTEQNRENLDKILSPLKEKLSEFEKKVSDVYYSETRERAALAEQLKNLHELNKQMTEEAGNLTRALKGSSRTQGTWGEVILESILEKSGLEKGREFLVQESFRNEQGVLFRPDVIVSLPDDKSIVIDSKVSLTSYELYSSSDNPGERDKALVDHIASVRRHFKNLSPKEYQNLYGLHSLDFVLMFIAVEPAFTLAVQNDQSLFYDAFEKNIIIVSPSTLLATLRTISSIWKQEKQTRNAIEIAKKGGELYDKIAAFVDDLIKVGQRMDDAKKSYEEAMNKLKDGKGNIISRAENLKQMGVKAARSIDPRIAGSSNDNDEDDDGNPEPELKLIQ